MYVSYILNTSVQQMHRFAPFLYAGSGGGWSGRVRFGEGGGEGEPIFGENRIFWSFETWSIKNERSKRV